MPEFPEGMHQDRIAAAEMTAAANERAGLSSRQRRHAAAFRKGAETAATDRHTLITAIFGTDNYDHTLPVSYFVEMLAAERRRKDELVRVGSGLANIAFNLAQHAALPDDTRRMLHQECAAWDRARQPEPRT